MPMSVTGTRVVYELFDRTVTEVLLDTDLPR